MLVESPGLVEARLHDGGGGEGCAGAATLLVLDRRDEAQSAGVVGSGRVGAVLSEGVEGALGVEVEAVGRVGGDDQAHGAAVVVLFHLHDQTLALPLKLLGGEQVPLIQLLPEAGGSLRTKKRKT